MEREGRVSPALGRLAPSEHAVSENSAKISANSLAGQ